MRLSVAGIRVCQFQTNKIIKNLVVVRNQIKAPQIATPKCVVVCDFSLNQELFVDRTPHTTTVYYSAARRPHSESLTLSPNTQPH
jgi:hypothetical protein